MPSQTPTVVMLCGKGQIAVEALRFTLSYISTYRLACSIVACPNSDDKGYSTWYPSLISHARSLGVPVIASPYEYSSEPNLLLISLEYNKIIKVEKFASKRLYNIHFSKLPKYRGVYTSIWPILNGELESGVTLHTLRPGIDDGNIVGQITFPISSSTTARQLYQLYLDYAFLLYKQYLADLFAKPLDGFPQDDGQATYYNRASIDFSRDSIISMKLTGEEIVRKVRAFYFPEYQVASFEGRGVRQAWIVGSSDAAPGTQLAETPISKVYVAADGLAVELVWA